MRDFDSCYGVEPVVDGTSDRRNICLTDPAVLAFSQISRANEDPDHSPRPFPTLVCSRALLCRVYSKDHIPAMRL